MSSSTTNLPSKEQLREIAARQDAKEKEVAAARASERRRESGNKERNAAEVIQRNYRGYRSRREMAGYGISSQTRWLEALKEGTRFPYENGRKELRDFEFGR